MVKSTRLKVVCLLLIVMGAAISGYLLFRQLSLWNPSAPTGSGICTALFGVDCDTALRSAQSLKFGFPLAGWGLVYYGTLAALLLMGWTLGETFRDEAALAGLALAVLAGLISLVLAMMILLAQAPFCPLCLAVHGINVLLIFPLWRLAGRSIPQFFQAALAGLRYLLAGRTANPAQARWKALGFFAAALVGVVVYQWIFIEITRLSAAMNRPFDPAEVLAAYDSATAHDIPLDANDPALGPADATMQIVVFSDFQCPACKGFAPALAKLLKQYEESIRVVFKHYPLDQACNPNVRAAQHPLACAAARAAEAARQQGQFWAFHDALFAAGLDTAANAIHAIAEDLKLDMPQFEASWHDAATAAKVSADISLGKRLNIPGTPTVFINGRQMSDTRLRALETVIDHGRLAANAH